LQRANAHVSPRAGRAGGRAGRARERAGADGARNDARSLEPGIPYALRARASESFMSDPHVERIRAQFTRQAETYAEMQQHDEAGLRLLVALAGARAGDRALDV